jgi:hypothetical protein
MGGKGIYNGRVIYAFADYEAIDMPSNHASTRIKRVPISISAVTLCVAEKSAQHQYGPSSLATQKSDRH